MSTHDTLHWCNEEIPVGAEYYSTTFDQSLTESHFLGGLQREASWINILPKTRRDTFDILRLKYLVPSLRFHSIPSSKSSLNDIENELKNFSQYLLKPNHSFVYLFKNFDFCDHIEYIPVKHNNIDDNDDQFEYKNYTKPISLFKGKYINKYLIKSISNILKTDKLNELIICEDFMRTGRGLRVLSYPQQYRLKQNRFVIRAFVEYKYPGKYIVNTNLIDILIMDNNFDKYVDNIQTNLKFKSKKNILIEQERLWKPLLIDQSTTQASSSDDDNDNTVINNYTLKQISAIKKPTYRISAYWTKYLFYDFYQNRIKIENIIKSIINSSKNALKCANMQRAFNSKINESYVYCGLTINDSNYGNVSDSDQDIYANVYRLNILKTVNCNLAIKQMNGDNDDDNDDNKDDNVVSRSIGELILDIIRNNLDENHLSLLLSPNILATDFVEIINKLLEYLKLKENPQKKRTNLLLFQERCIIIFGDVLWYFNKRYSVEFKQWISKINILNDLCQYISSNDLNITQLNDKILLLLNIKNDDDLFTEYYGYLEPFLKASNEKELIDFNECAHNLLVSTYGDNNKNVILKYNDNNIQYSTSSGMRVGISSANASDNWTNSKLNGGVTINMSINLDSIKKASSPVSASVNVIFAQNIIKLSTTHTMNNDGDISTDNIEFNLNNISLFFKNIDDNRDVFRMLKYSLIFVGIIRTPHDSSTILNDIQLFCGKNNGLFLKVINLGPSRSGFASSSAVACNLLKVLYSCCNNQKSQNIASNDKLLGSMALLFENRLGLKSGRQDVDGLLPNGIKILKYNRTTSFLSPSIKYLSASSSLFNISSLNDNMILVNSGIARASGLGLHRGLNMRFLAYLSRDSIRFKSILKSYYIHNEIILALMNNNYCYLGKLFLDYMDCRQNIDPGATQSIYDADHNNNKILRYLFDPLIDKNLIYGGMFTGAMGGGVAMLLLTKYGKQNIEFELNKLKKWKTNNGKIPFKKLNIIKYSINMNGIKLTKSNIKCKIYSDSIKKWFNAKIIKIDNDGKWITVQYYVGNQKRIKQIQPKSNYIKY